jgi:hypothetical protein
MAKVFLVNEAGHDFSSAQKYGELIAVTTGNINIKRPDRDLFTIKESLAEFCYKDDFLLPSGNILANIMVCGVLFNELKIKSLKLLIYNAKTHDYLEHILSYNNREVKFLRQPEEEKVIV